MIKVSLTNWLFPNFAVENNNKISMISDDSLLIYVLKCLRLSRTIMNEITGDDRGTFDKKFSLYFEIKKNKHVHHCRIRWPTTTKSKSSRIRFWGLTKVFAIIYHNRFLWFLSLFICRFSCTQLFLSNYHWFLNWICSVRWSSYHSRNRVTNEQKCDYASPTISHGWLAQPDFPF